MRASPPRRALSVGLIAGMFALSAAGTAKAQYAYEPDLLLPPRAVVWRLNDRGFTEVTRPRFDGRAYIVEASNPYGDRLRLFVDARDGRILGRQRLDIAPEAPPRLVRRAPGYGWTEDDMRPRRPIREAERIVPPADIPSVPGLRGAPLGSERSAARSERVPPAARPDANSLGVNPDAAARSEPPRRAAARTAPTPKLPSQAHIAPTAPEPSLRSGSPASPAMTPAAKTERDKRETKEAKAVEPKVGEPRPETGKAETKTDAAKPEPVKDATKTAESKPAAGKGWQDPPADGPRKNVRVIGGATVVPGGANEAGGTE